MRPLFPYFGGKGKCAEIVDILIGDVSCYIEPFAGSAAVFWGRRESKREILNDLDGYITNFYRAVRNEPEKVYRLAEWPSSELDLRARHQVIIDSRKTLEDKLIDDPDWFDEKLAGWWWWGISSWFGQGWGWRNGKTRPHIDRSLKGVHRTSLEEVKQAAERLSNTTLLCGDFERAMTPAILKRFPTVGIFLDPPYSVSTGRKANLYAKDSEASADLNAQQWAVDHGESCKIVFAGYAAALLDDAGWDQRQWDAPQGMSYSESNNNKEKETLWISPSIIVEPESLFE